LFKRRKVWVLKNLREKATHIEADMDAKLFDEVTRHLVTVEIEGDRMAFLETPLKPFVVHRKEEMKS